VNELLLEKNNELPQGWYLTSFDNVCEIKGGFAFKSKDFLDKGIPLIRISNIQTNKIDFNQKTVHLPNSFKDFHREFLIQNNDILVALSGATTGKFGVYHGDKILLLNQRVGLIRSKNPKLILQKFILYYFGILRKFILKQAYGMAQPNISTNDLKRFQIPIPPLNEQKRIVSKIEELLSIINTKKEILEKIQYQLRIWTSSLLTNAFNGNLSIEWRKNNSNQDDVIKYYRKITNDFNFEIQNFDKNSKLTQDWILIPFQKTCTKITDGEHLKPKFVSEGVPFLSAQHVREDEVIFTNSSKISKQDAKIFRSKCDPKKNDILIVSRGATVGRSCIVNSDKEFCLLGSVILIKPIPSINSKYLSYFLKSPKIKKDLINLSGSTAQQAIYLRDIKKILIPLCSLSEQEFLSRKLDHEMSIIKNIRQEIGLNYQLLTNLTNSIFKKAFEGKLVPQDPNDESAEVLLQKIKKEIYEAVPKIKSKKSFKKRRRKNVK